MQSNQQPERASGQTWKSFADEAAAAESGILTPARVEGAPVYVAAVDGFLAWTYRCQPTFVFGHGQPWVYWIRRVADSVEWYGDAPRLADAKAAALARIERIRSTGRG